MLAVDGAKSFTRYVFNSVVRNASYELALDLENLIKHAFGKLWTGRPTIFAAL